MQSYGAREVSPGQWQYVRMHEIRHADGSEDIQMKAVGYCAAFTGRDCRHDSKEAAEECYRQWLLDTAKFIPGEHSDECFIEDCRNRATHIVSSHEAGEYEKFCDKHANTTSLASILRVGDLMKG